MDMIRKSVPVVVLVGVLSLALFGAAPASAELPWWQLTSSSVPANLQAGGEGNIIVLATNVGDSSARSDAVSPLVLSDSLPSGLEAVAIKGREGDLDEEVGLTCSLAPLGCKLEGVTSVVPYQSIEVSITVKVLADAHSGEENHATISGAGAASVSASQSLTVGGTTSFGVEQYEMVPENEGGTPDTQAGSHPFQLTTTIALNETADRKSPPALVKDLHFNLPPGLVGNPTPLPQCSELQFTTTVGLEKTLCPVDTQIGTVAVTIYEPHNFQQPFTLPAPLFNLAPLKGEPARFAFNVLGVPVILDTSVRTGSDYGVTVSVDNISQTAAFLSSRVTFWGDPGDPRHDQSREGCVGLGQAESEERCPGGAFPQSFLTMPTSCTGPLSTTVQADSWLEPDNLLAPFSYTFKDALGQPFGMAGCNRLHFDPSIGVAPDGQAASTPTGLTVGLHVPQLETLAPEGLAQADVKDTTVALPAGVQLSPAAADGLSSCSNAEIGFTGVSASGTDEFTSGAPSCPEASKVATVKIDTPLLPDPLEGAVYLAAPQNFAGPLENPFGSLVALYLVAEDPTAGVVVKLPGKVTPDPVTGQLVSTFEDTPQLPFEELELHFFGSARAPLSTPALCGAYTTTASIAPWSGNDPALPFSSFDITSGPNGGPCPGSSLPFAPSLASDTTNIQAGAFTPLTTTLSREDGQQNIQSVQLHYPAGLSGLLSGVKLCGEAQANAGTCGAESLIGETIVSVGLGGDPFTVTGGRVYITEGYEGAPFGLSIVNPAKAGPFDLQEGRPVVVRAKIEVDPHTAALTITTDNTGAHKIPTIIEGIPLQIKHVNVLINRPGFTFNPTNCAKMAITGQIDSAEGASSPVGVPFQVTNCASLAFAPKFAVSTSGKTSRAAGASLTAKLSYPSAPQGTQANITRVKVDLPKQLPSRLTTLQKACTNAQFEANPAGCPSASKIGYATVTTPLLPVPLTGPAIFVSHGGEAFPTLTMVLQGYGVTVDLVGSTFISKAGITSTTFKTVPDTPFNTFTLTLPEGKYSALAANVPEKDHGDLCGQKLEMPTEFVGQNGAQIKQSTPITAEGCSTSLFFTHAIKKKALTLHVYAPAAGKITASGKGLTERTKTAKGREELTLILKQKNAGKLKTTVKVAFTPSAGKDRKKQSKGAKLTFK